MTSYLIKGPVTTATIATAINEFGLRKDTGAHTVFLGQVRADTVEGKTVKAIEYSAYEEMVRLEVSSIRESVLRKFSDVLEIKIIHSTGTVKSGEISMLVLVSAGHRDHAISACREVVELIKERLPVWKKEIYEDNTWQWKGAAGI